jgi:arylsulfatase A-like enzyme
VPAHYGVRTKQWKLIYYYGKALGTAGSIDRDTAPEWELFDMRKDPHEMKNVYGDPSNEKVVTELKKELARLRKVYRDEDGV